MHDIRIKFWVKESDRVRILEQCSESNAADKVKIEREEKNTKQLYMFLSQSGSSLVLLALSRRVHYNPNLITNAQGHKQETSNTQAHKQEIFYAQAQKQETSKQTNYKEICLRFDTWYTISGVHNTNQIQSLKTLEFLRYESC